MTSWHPNDDIEDQADQIDQLVEAVVVVIVAMLCIAGLAYGPGIVAALGL
jgi:hypothetical protein